MLTLEDCIALSDLTLEEIDAISEHEHLPETIAAELGCYLVHCPDGRRAIRSMMRDDIEAARGRGDLRHAAELKLVLQQFVGRCHRDPAIYGRWNGPTSGHS
jgi:hypothetical protein